MQLIRDVFSRTDTRTGAVLALGNFDGMHLGHQAILRQAREIATRENSPLAVMTFEPHPREFLNPTQKKLRIYPFRRKAELCAASGIDMLFALRFNRAFSTTSAQTFVDTILHDTLGVRHIITGTNFFFGHQRQGDKEFLTQAAARLGFSYTAHEPVLDAGGGIISSSHIRELLKHGDMRGASAQLGRPYAITGKVQRGEQRGRTIGTPTANLIPRGLFLPRFGVYAAQVTLADGTQHNAIANLGVKPTFGEHAPTLETHLFDFTGDLYGQRIDVALVAFLRDERAFANIDALKTQIAHDCKKARTHFQESPLP